MVKSQTTHPVAAWKLAAGGKQAQPVSFKPAPKDINDACQRFPGGAYTTLRTYQGNRVLRLDQHFQRLEESAAILGQPVVVDRKAVRAALRTAVSKEPVSETSLPVTPVNSDDCRLRLILDLEQAPGDVYIIRAGLITPSNADYLNGVRVITSNLHRELPDAKLTGFLEKAVRHPLPPDVNEALMVDELGCLLEGLSSNFYAVIDGEVWTAGEGVLPGTTRSLVLAEIQRVGIPLRLEAPRLEDIPAMSEAFLTSTSRGVLPVVRIDDQWVGDGVPGVVVRQLDEGFWKQVFSELEEI